ncbi:hypothetical protein [uncultured Campylobacter sp.]|uniref:hypothetical protein n=1 Tax=uncultured Campylobacter sp. TaxID=218934 RepID=UPI00262B515F|nr:hypothetical protein [uncultured Campylobacter sp.]
MSFKIYAILGAVIALLLGALKFQSWQASKLEAEILAQKAQIEALKQQVGQRDKQMEQISQAAQQKDALSKDLAQIKRQIALKARKGGGDEISSELNASANFVLERLRERP